MQLQEFKIRASKVGQIMTNPRGKNETLSETCKSYLDEWIKEQVYGIRKQIKSKYITKGLMLEDHAIEFYSIAKDHDFMLKNTEFFSNDLVCGTPDLIHDGVVYDFKTSWDCFTFPLFETTPDKGYWMQLQAYMHLTGCKKAKLVYTLQNTPEEISFEGPVTYDHVPMEYRIKEFSFSYDAEFMEAVESRVLECRKYIDNEQRPFLSGT